MNLYTHSCNRRSLQVEYSAPSCLPQMQFLPWALCLSSLFLRNASLFVLTSNGRLLTNCVIPLHEDILWEWPLLCLCGRIPFSSRCSDRGWQWPLLSLISALYRVLPTWGRWQQIPIDVASSIGKKINGTWIALLNIGICDLSHVCYLTQHERGQPSKPTVSCPPHLLQGQE